MCFSKGSLCYTSQKNCISNRISEIHKILCCPQTPPLLNSNHFSGFSVESNSTHYILMFTVEPMSITPVFLTLSQPLPSSCSTLPSLHKNIRQPLPPPHTQSSVHDTYTTYKYYVKTCKAVILAGKVVVE